LNWVKKIVHSVFARLVLISLITWFCIVLAAGVIFMITRLKAAGPFHSNIVQYFSYVIDDLGSPPSLKNAKKIQEQTGLNIAYNGKISWSLIPELSPNRPIRYHTFYKKKDISFGGSRGRHFLKYSHDKGEFLFEFSGYNKNKTRAIFLHGILLISLTVIIFCAYLAIRRVLRPIKWLQEGVEEVGKGNLSHTVPDQKKDEFGKLATAFNAMTQQLHGMLKSKEQLLRDVSHELRTPLTRMKVALEFVENDEAKKDISADIKEMETMVTTILENLKLHHNHGHLNKSKIDLTVLVKQQTSLFKNQMPAVHFETVEPIICDIDQDRIKTVLKNILENSIKYSHTNSQPIRVNVLHQTPWAIVKIQDYGVGIDKDTLPLILEPFYRADQSRSKKTGGYGLGLSLCKTIMEAHQGKIQIQSTLGTGTCVTLFFPV